MCFYDIVQWNQGHGGICRNTLQVCDFQNGSQQDNWLFTQYISYPSSSANEIFVRITYNFSECRDYPMCHITYFNVLRYDTNSQSPQERVKSINYNLIKRVEQPSQSDEITATVSFQRPSDSTGLYLALQDVGSCGVIFRIQVYYEQCPSKVVGLVTYPALPLPARNGPATAVGYAVCALHAENSSLLEFRAFRDGECERTVTCECSPGYMEEQQLIAGTTLLVSQCRGEASILPMSI